MLERRSSALRNAAGESAAAPPHPGHRPTAGGPRLGALALAGALLVAPAVALQPPQEPPVDPPREGPTEGPADPATDALQPGVLPADTDPAAAELWTALTAALRDPESLERRIDAFAIRFDLRARSGARSNDVQVTARFLAPDFVAFTDAAGRQVGLGPEGPWLEERDGKVVRMLGREYRQDRRNLAQTRNLARNYLALTDPGRIRIESLRRLEGLPPELPEIRGLRPGFLDWLELVTPDFGVVALPPERREEESERPAPPGTPPPPPGAPPAPVADDDGAELAPAGDRPPRFRVLIGCDRRDHLPTLITIRSAEPLPPEQQVEHCIHLREYQPNRRTRGLLLPWVLDVYERWPAVPGFDRFPDVASQAIWLIEARVDDLGLSPESFVPPGLRDATPR